MFVSKEVLPVKECQGGAFIFSRFWLGAGTGLAIYPNDLVLTEPSFVPADKDTSEHIPLTQPRSHTADWAYTKETLLGHLSVVALENSVPVILGSRC